MKILYATLLTFLLGHVSAADTPPTPEPQLMTYLLWWPGAVESRNDPPSTMFYTSPESESWVSVVHTSNAPLDLSRIDAAMLSTNSFANIRPTPRRYGLLGTIICEDVAPGSYLEMTSGFESIDPKKSSGPIYTQYKIKAPIADSSTGREFSLPFDSSKIKGYLDGLSLNIHLAGKGKLTLKDVRLVRYPDPLPSSVTPTDLTPTSPPIIGTLVPAEPPPVQALNLDQVAEQTTAQHEHALKITWFWIGVGATTSILFILAGCAVIFVEVRKKSKEQELRRIASLDS